MIIENNILSISKTIFQNRDNYKYVTDEQKESVFFIFNRYFSKKYPEKSQLLNDKLIDKVSAMDLWFHFLDGKPYPNWFWSKGEKSKSSSEFTEKEIEFLKYKLDIKDQEIGILLKYHANELKDE